MFDTITSSSTIRALIDIPELPPALYQQAQERLMVLEEEEEARRYFWNSARAIRATLVRQRDYRWSFGYSENEAARGVDEQESYEWEEMSRRIRFLRHRALRKMRRV